MMMTHLPGTVAFAGTRRLSKALEGTQEHSKVYKDTHTCSYSHTIAITRKHSLAFLGTCMRSQALEGIRRHSSTWNCIYYTDFAHAGRLIAPKQILLKFHPSTKTIDILELLSIDRYRQNRANM